MKEDIACRVCASLDITRLPIGVYASFFELRIDTSKDPFAMYSYRSSVPLPEKRHSLRAKMRRFAQRNGRRRNANNEKRFFRTMCQFCINCHSITPSHEYSFHDLSGFYHDYRCDSYNSDRIAVEPGYRKIANLVGKSIVEERVRNAGVSKFLAAHKDGIAGGSVLDLGGSDGKFIPSCIIDAFEAVDILDASAVPVHPQFDQSKMRKVSQAKAGAYSLLTCMHVLEHVGNPRAFLVDALPYLKPGAHLYLEVPLESTPEVREQFRSRTIDIPFYIHEHLNMYDVQSIPKLVASIAELELIDSQNDVIEIGWATGTVGRYLLKRIK